MHNLAIILYLFNLQGTRNVLRLIYNCIYSLIMLILWVVSTFSNGLLLITWHLAITKCCPVGITKDTLDFVIQLDCGAATTEDVLFFSVSPATVHFINEGGLLRPVSQLKCTTSPCFASPGPLIWAWLEPSARMN